MSKFILKTSNHSQKNESSAKLENNCIVKKENKAKRIDFYQGSAEADEALEPPMDQTQPEISKPSNQPFL